MTARLTRLDWPDFGSPDLPPEPDLAEYRGRLASVRAGMAARGWGALVVYGDREHAANIHWLTGFDPRFEEAVLVVTPGAALLVAGNECLPYTGVSPLVAAGDVAAAHCASLSLPSQPRGGARLADILAGAVPAGATAGAAGWKWFDEGEVDEPATTLDLPDFVAAPLRRIAGRVENATALFQHPGHGLRARVDAAGIARLEFANHMAASALRRMVFAFREGMTDFEAVQAAAIGGMPLGCHPTFATGARATQGLSGPTGQVLEAGQPISFNICHWGANICRAGWLARDDGDLPAAARGYLEAFVGPYVRAMSGWCALMRPGVPGGQVWAAMQAALPFDPFGVFLNPGHLIGLDEWMSSPIAEGSAVPLASGMAMQMDVIPGHPVFGSTRMEDGYVIADAALRVDLAARFPAVAARCAARAEFMRRVIGMEVPDTLLPLADTCGIVAPFLLDPGQVVVLR
ncbi:MAG TPA: M24 family metallopeptidase [Paracoccaceae bacterium]|nr:M24 family metallopeptidase [Paracoccaceae bacterium]